MKCTDCKKNEADVKILGTNEFLCDHCHWHIQAWNGNAIILKYIRISDKPRFRAYPGELPQNTIDK